MIRFEHVEKTFPDGTRAVEDFSLEVPPHTTTVLLGSSGCGKTTLLQMVNRMVDPTGGRVLIEGRDVASLDPVKLRRGIGYVMQNAGLLPHRTVLDNVLTVPRLTGRISRQDRDHAHELLELVGLPAAVASRYPSQLSGGQRQRVGVARALAPDPDVLLMDEPFSAVDPVVRADLQAEMLRIQRERMHAAFFPSSEEYARLWGLSPERLAGLSARGAQTAILHPGPMNRGLEISADAADSPRSLVLRQVANGVSVRMAVLYHLLTGAPDPAGATGDPEADRA